MSSTFANCVRAQTADERWRVCDVFEYCPFNKFTDPLVLNNVTTEEDASGKPKHRNRNTKPSKRREKYDDSFEFEEPIDLLGDYEPTYLDPTISRIPLHVKNHQSRMMEEPTNPNTVLGKAKELYLIACTQDAPRDLSEQYGIDYQTTGQQLWDNALEIARKVITESRFYENGQMNSKELAKIVHEKALEVRGVQEI